MLTLRRGTVLALADAGLPTGRLQRLDVDVAGERRPAIADVGLLGECAVGDEIIVNVAALDLGLGSGGFDVVHVNLTRGLDRAGTTGAHVMKLNYTSLQHAVCPVEEKRDPGGSGATGVAPATSNALDAATVPSGRPQRLRGAPVAVLALHGQLAPVAWAAQQAVAGARIGYVQTCGGALPGALSDSVRQLRARGLLADHITAGASYGGEAEAITLLGALEHGFAALGWEGAICGPGPGLLGSTSALGHGGIAALESAHGAIALGGRALIVPRMSSGDARDRHRGLSHHSATVLELLLRPALVALPAPDTSAIQKPPSAAGDLVPAGDSIPAGDLIPAADELPGDHEARFGVADLDGYGASGLPAVTMGRGIEQDPLFFAAALAGGDVLAGMIRGR